MTSNINEVIRAVLNPLFFAKKFCTHQKPKKNPRKAQKAQKRNQAKVQTATSEQK